MASKDSAPEWLQECPHDGCTEALPVQQLLEHMSLCAYGFNPCEKCAIPVRLKNLQAHDKDCQGSKCECSSCGKVFANKLHLHVHQRTSPRCLKAAGQCYYHEYCNFSTNNVEDLRQHLLTNVGLHLTSLTENLQQIQETVENPSQVQDTLSETAGFQMKRIEKMLANLVVNQKEMENRFERQMERLDPAIGGVKTIGKRSESPRELCGDAEKCYKQFDKLDSSVTLDEIWLEMMHQTRKITALGEKLCELEKSVLSCGFLWIIDNYTNRKSAHEQFCDSFLTSPAFYSSQYGYRLVALVYLNGVDEWTGSSMSIFLALEKGEYDDLLKWPCQQNALITLKGVNPDINSYQRILQFDPNDLASQRPPINEREFQGFHDYLDLEHVQRDFVCNDKLFLHIAFSSGGKV